MKFRGKLNGCLTVALALVWPSLASSQEPLVLDLGGGITAKVYGYVKADFIWDDGYDLGRTTGGLKNIGLPAGGPVGRFDRQQLDESRIGVDIRGPNELFARFEGDFFGPDSNLRLRHAYIDWYGVMVGQNWTNFMSVENLSDTVDFQTSLAYPFARVPQLRYTYTDWKNTTVSASIEQDVANEDDLAYTLSARFDVDRGMVRVSGLWRDTDIGGTQLRGWGVNLSSVVSFWQGGTIKANLTTGKGIADILNAGLNGSAVSLGGNSVGVNTATLSVSQQVNDKLKLALTADWLDLEQSVGTDTDSLRSVHVSAFYEIRKNVTLMAEYYTGGRSQADGVKFRSDRVQLAIKYAF